jgi:hypothetical protein
MKRKVCSFALAVVVASMIAPKTTADDQGELITKQEGYTVSLDLKFSKKRQNPLERIVSVLDYGPNGYATGFIVGNGLVMTSYHVVSGDINSSKKVALGFGREDQLAVDVSVGNCQARVLMVDKDADLALLGVCQSRKQPKAPPFQPSLSKDEKLFVIARPHGEKMVRRGSFYGPYTLRGQQYWSARLEGQDGYSGSPVYNDKAEVIGVFCGYDWTQKLAVISPGERAQKLLDDYAAKIKQ